MSEHIDYQIYEKRLLLTLPIDFDREGGIYQGVGISDVAGLIFGLMSPNASLRLTLSD